MHVFTQPIFIGIAILALLYSIWIIMSGIGLHGVTVGENIKTIRQQAGLSLLGLTLLSLLTLAAYYFFFPTSTPPLPS